MVIDKIDHNERNKKIFKAQFSSKLNSYTYKIDDLKSFSNDAMIFTRGHQEKPNKPNGIKFWN
jgi:hypothetical protein